MLMKVRIVNRKGLQEGGGFLDNTFNECFEVGTKAEAKKLARIKYTVKDGYVIGQVWKPKA